MKHPLRSALFAACLATRLAATDAPAAAAAAPATPAATTAADDQRKLEEAIRLRLAEHILRKAAPPAAAPATTSGSTAATTAQAADKAREDPALQLPRVEVNQSRITEEAIALREKDLEIAREKQKTKPTALDNSLNDSDVSHTLSIFGGSASEDRARLAQERVSLLEAERDLMEEINRARTKEEKDDLTKQLNDLKTMRRELEHSPGEVRGE